MEKKNRQKEVTSDPYDIDIQACSATDCTGLMPTLPHSEAELESYRELYSYDAARNVKRQKEREAPANSADSSPSSKLS